MPPCHSSLVESIAQIRRRVTAGADAFERGPHGPGRGCNRVDDVTGSRPQPSRISSSNALNSMSLSGLQDYGKYDHMVDTSVEPKCLFRGCGNGRSVQLPGLDRRVPHSQ